MKPHFFVISLLMFFHIQIIGQTKIIGKLQDAQTNSPVDFATIYINGTTNGTISDSSGYFKLDNVKIPCQLIVSHIGYITQSVSLDNSLPKLLNLQLTPREIVVDEVKVSDKNLRESNILTFRENFLGTDVWGKYATIENEDALIFSRDFETLYITLENKQLPNFIFNPAPEFQYNNDSTLASYKVPIDLRVNSNKPLIINLPLLGYNLYVNLVSFIYGYNSSLKADESSTLGFYYFNPIIPETKRDSIRISKNRLKAYYNSSTHFCRSLFNKSLEKNGYRVFEKITLNQNNKTSFKEIKLDSCLNIKGNQAEVIGLNEKCFYIFYHHRLDGTPIDLTHKKGALKPVQTVLYFLADTCIIRNDGTTPGNSLAFDSFIGSKKVGAMLPDNYEPPNK